MWIPCSRPLQIIACALSLKNRLEALIASEGETLTIWKVTDWEIAEAPLPIYTISAPTQAICVNAILEDALAAIKHYLEELP